MNMNLHGVSLELTCTGLHSLRPSMTSVSVACTSAVLVPRTTGRATTDRAEFPEDAAFEARHHAPNHRGNGGGRSSDDKLSFRYWST